MSRSYKKYPGWKDHNKDVKALANRRARRPWYWNSTSSGMAYKKLTDRWDICDWNFRYFSEREVENAIERQVKRNENLSLKERLRFAPVPKYKYYMK